MDKFLQDAIEEYERNIDNCSNFYMDAETLLDIEDYYEKEGRLFDADRLLIYAEKMHPQHEEVLIVKAYRLKNRGKWNEALTVIGEVTNRENRDVQALYNPQIKISAESETKRSIFREKDKTKRSKKESAQHSKSRNKSFVMTSVSAL